MIASMFNLEHRLAELRPSESELRTARELRKAGAPAARPERSVVEPRRSWTGNAVLGSHLSRLAAF